MSNLKSDVSDGVSPQVDVPEAERETCAAFTDHNFLKVIHLDSDGRTPADALTQRRQMPVDVRMSKCRLHPNGSDTSAGR